MWSWIDDLFDWITAPSWLLSKSFWLVFFGLALSLGVSSQIEDEPFNWIVAVIVFLVYLRALRYVSSDDEDDDVGDDDDRL